MCPAYRRVVIEADGGSRGNPGPAAYGALVRDADTGTVIAERAETIGVATNNVAEYRGLIAGLELAAEHAPDAELEVRMDSKLVIEQMAGRWKVKHPDMRPLAMRAQQLAPFGVEWTWVPREDNKAADAILNVALDEQAGKSPRVRRGVEPTTEPVQAITPALAGWRDELADPPTTLVLLRHGVTDSTLGRLFSGWGGADPGLTDDGHAQAERAAAYLARHGVADVVVSSPLRRARETAAHVAAALGLEVEVHDGVAETAFGEWDGLSIAQVEQRWPTELQAWLSSPSVAPPGGESYDTVHERVRVARDAVLADHLAERVVVVSHVTPIKLIVCLALDADAGILHRLEVPPASLSTVRVWPDGVSTLRAFGIVPH